MYQAMLGSQGQSRAGLVGLAAGLGVGLLVLAVVALVVRATSVRLPLRAFTSQFQRRGALQYGGRLRGERMIFELNECGLLKTTLICSGPGGWLGQGIRISVLYPHVQTLSIEGLLLSCGAVLAADADADRQAEGGDQGLGRGFRKKQGDADVAQALGGSADYDTDRRRGGVASRAELEPVERRPSSPSTAGWPQSHGP